MEGAYFYVPHSALLAWEIWQTSLALGNEPWEIRIGVHTGPIIAGKTSSEFDIWGDSVNIAARLENSGEKMKVNCSEETKSFLSESYQYDKKENIKLKGKGMVDTFIINQKD